MKSWKKRITRMRTLRKARGTAAVEFAVVLPLLCLMLFGIIEYGYVFMVRQTVQHAAREGCRLAVLQTSVEPYANVTARIADVMSAANLSGYTVTMTHASAGDPVETISVTIPHSQFSLIGGIYSNPLDSLTGTCSMRKEGFTSEDS